MDPRSLRTQEALENALLTLLGERPLNSITVTEICKLAGVTRAAFYGHYRNTDELMNHVKGKFMTWAYSLIEKHLLEISSGNTYGITRELFVRMDEKPELFSLVFGPYSEPNFMMSVIACTEERFFKYFDLIVGAEENGNVLKDAFRLRYLSMCSGTLSLLKSWCLHDRRWPADIMARVVSAMNTPICAPPPSEMLDIVGEAISEYGSLHTMQDAWSRAMHESAAALVAEAEAASK